MKEFNSLDELQREIEEDSKRRARFPVRFITLSDLKSWNLLISFLRSNGSQFIHLSDYCKGRDTLPNFERVLGDIDRNLKEGQRITLIPFSEYLRFFRDGSVFIRDLALLERLDGLNTGTRARLYVPLYGIDVIFNQALKGISRFQLSGSGECAEVYALSSKDGSKNSEIRLNITNKGVNSKRLTGNKIDGIKEYFSLWERGISGADYLLITDMVDRVKEVDDKVTIRTFNSNFRVLTNTIQDGDKLNKDWGTESQWSYLIETLPGSSMSLSEGIRNGSNIVFDQQYVFFRWQEYSLDERWLIWLYFKLNPPTGYLKIALDKTSSFEQFVDRIVDAVLDMDPKQVTPDVMLERKKVLENVLKQDLPLSFWERLKSVPDRLKIRYLTGLTESEKAESIRLIANSMDTLDYSEHLQVVYPELKHYMSDYNYGEEEVNEYFRRYKRAKLMDQLTTDVKDLALKLSEDKAFLKFPSRGSVLENLHGYVYWFDSLGVEWLSLIEALLEEEFDNIGHETRIARCNIPSITELNKGWEDLADYREYDKLIHDNVMGYPDYIVRELKCIRDGIADAVNKLGRHAMVIITSDHGSSRLSAISEERMDPIGLEPERYGRYARKIEGRPCNSKELIEQDGHVVIATHKRFEGHGYRAVELHGGATLEEVLVPVISIWKKDKVERRKIEIVEFLSSVKLNQEGIGKLNIRLNTPVEDLSITLQGKIYSGTYKEGIWEFIISGIKSGMYEAELSAGNEKIGKIKFEVIRGIKERDMGL